MAGRSHWFPAVAAWAESTKVDAHCQHLDRQRLPTQQALAPSPRP